MNTAQELPADMSTLTRTVIDSLGEVRIRALAITPPVSLHGPNTTVSLIVPARNEAQRITATLRRYHAELSAQFGRNFEIVVVANACTDDTTAVTQALAQELNGIRLVDIPDRIGKGGAVLEGFRHATGERVLFADADGATEASSLLRLAESLDDHDVVIGSRRMPGSVIDRHRLVHRRALSRCFEIAVRHLFRLPFHDTQCGAKAFRASAVRSLLESVQERGWAFDVDVLLSARALGLSVQEVPVTWSEQDRSTLRVLPTSREVCGAFWRLKRRRTESLSTRTAPTLLPIPVSPDSEPECTAQKRTAVEPRLRILALNWRCLRHPQAGGAEVNIFEQARRWTAMGHSVTVFTSDPGREHAPSKVEFLDGVRVIRRGGRYSVYLHAAVYVLATAYTFDRIIDVENGIPFFTPLFTSRPVVLLVHHVHDRQWHVEVPGLAGRMGRFLECRAMPYLYAHQPVIAVSPTTQEMLVRLGFRSSNIRVVYNGVSLSQAERQDPPGRWDVVYVGRLKRYKRIEQLVDLVGRLRAEFPEVHLHVVGDGDARETIERRVVELGLQRFVTLHGFVDEAAKVRILSKARVFATPSMQEGWGLSVIEANALGCPAVAYNVPGLRVAIRHGETGLLAEDEEEFAAHVASMLGDTPLHDRCSSAARSWASSFDWDASAQASLEIISAHKREPRRRAVSPHVNERGRLVVSGSRWLNGTSALGVSRMTGGRESAVRPVRESGRAGEDTSRSSGLRTALFAAQAVLIQLLIVSYHVRRGTVAHYRSAPRGPQSSTQGRVG